MIKMYLIHFENDFYFFYLGILCNRCYHKSFISKFYVDFTLINLLAQFIEFS